MTRKQDAPLNLELFSQAPLIGEVGHGAVGRDAARYALRIVG